MMRLNNIAQGQDADKNLKGKMVIKYLMRRPNIL